MGGKGVSNVISIVLLLVVVDARQLSISIPGNNGETVACCPNLDAIICFVNCLRHWQHFPAIALDICTQWCDCPLVDSDNCSLGCASSIHDSGIGEEEARKRCTKGSKIAMTALA